MGSRFSCRRVNMHIRKLTFVNMASEKFTSVKFSERLTELIEHSGCTQREIAQGCGLSEGALVNYKRGRIPKAGELHNMAKFFGVTMEYLLTGESNTPKQADGWRQRALALEQKMDAMRAGVLAALKKI